MVIQIYIALLLIIFFIMQFDGESLYKLIYYLPGYSAMRAVERIINIELLLFAFIVVYIMLMFYQKIKFAIFSFVYFSKSSYISYIHSFLVWSVILIIHILLIYYVFHLIIYILFLNIFIVLNH